MANQWPKTAWQLSNVKINMASAISGAEKQLKANNESVAIIFSRKTANLGVAAMAAIESCQRNGVASKWHRGGQRMLGGQRP